MKNTIFTISKMILSVATIPLWFVKMFIGVGHLPDQTTGEIVEVIFRHSMLENVGDLAHPILAYIVMAIAAVALVERYLHIGITQYLLADSNITRIIVQIIAFKYFIYKL